MKNNNVKKLRDAKRISQIELANAIGITRQTLSNLENGKSYPRFETIKKLMIYFDCSILVLMGREGIWEKNG